jgi:hypothetical protein
MAVITAIASVAGLSAMTAPSAAAAAPTAAAGASQASTSSTSTTMELAAGSTAGLAAAASNPAGCIVQVDDPHIAKSVHPWSVKVNARIKSCRYAVSNLYLDVQLWKTGFFVDYLQRETATSSPRGTSLANNGTFVNCKNGTNSRFYGEAYGQATIGGTVYSATVHSLHTPTIGCGT